MDNTNSQAVAVGHSVDPAVWRVVLAEVLARIGCRFARAEPRQTVGELLTGLIAPIERKNSWWLAEYAGHVCPDRMQRLLRTAVWDDQAVSTDLRDLVVAQFGRPDAVLVIDETGFLKKGTQPGRR